MQAQTRVVTAHVPIGLAKKIDQASARLERSRGWIIQKALVSWLDREETEKRLTLEALADVDAGRVLGHETVSAWAARLGKTKAKKR
ncbi:MAG: ribbon-helix-helix protein, CopG family [Elusimicrobia bacterium]|nr:ribbon-helix-helix protein, CopG family [Elusimicrobiota bacterium]